MNKLVFLLFLLMMPMLPLFCVDNYDEESFVIEAIIPGQTSGEPYSNLVVVDLTGSSDSHTVIQDNDQFYIGRGEQLQTGTGMDLFEIHYVTNNPAGAKITVTLGDFTKAVWDETKNSYVVENPTSPTTLATLDSTVGFGDLSLIGYGSFKLWRDDEIPEKISGDKSGQMNLYPDEVYMITNKSEQDSDRVSVMSFSVDKYNLSWNFGDGEHWKRQLVEVTLDNLPFNVELVKRFSVSIDSNANVDPGFYRMDVEIKVESNS